jgi:acetyl-CoA acetyltransferase
MNSRDAFRGKVAVVGIGQTPYYKRGTSPDAERKLCLRAIVDACADAGIDPRDIDGFSSYGADNNEGPRINYGLGTRELRWSTLIWGGGGGGSAGAVAAAASAIIAGQADICAVYRASAESSSGRLLDAVSAGYFGLNYLPHGMESPANSLALPINRLIEADGVAPEAIRALVKASYYHASNNPMAVGRNTDLTDEMYENSRLIVEPLHLFDCSRENDAAAAIILTSAERAKDLAQKPAYMLGCTMGCGPDWGELDSSHNPLSSAGFIEVGKRMWAQAGYGVQDVDVTQVYCNMSGAGVAAMIDMGFCTAESAKEVLTFENLIAPWGKLPINTGGGDLAEGFIHGMGNTLEAVRQVRGTSSNQVPGAKLSLLTGGPMAELVSCALFGSEETL